VFNLANNLRYQDAVRDIQRVFEPAEAAFFKSQTQMEKVAAQVFREQGSEGVQRVTNTYVERCLKQVGYAYDELVDYLMFRYLLDNSEVAPPRLPAISAPMIPAVPEN
jgi:hypothetical protein